MIPNLPRTLRAGIFAGTIVLSFSSLSSLFGAPPPDASSPLGGLSPFGIGSCHTNNTSAQANARWIPKMVAIGITNQRTCHTGWSAVEPEEGKWTWDALDGQMSYLESQQITFGGILVGSPKWNTKDKPGTLPVNNLPAWSEYVSEVVKHAKGKIHYWEVWNEPPNGTGRDQTAADYARIVVAAYDAAKAADPTCLIGIAAKSVDLNYLDQAIVAGAKDHFDYLTLHPYETMNGITANTGMEAAYMSIVPTVRKMLATRDPAKVNVPVLFTELGCNARKVGLDVQAQALVKAYAMGIAQGVTTINWFEAMDGDSGPMGLLEGSGNPRPAYMALAQMIQHLGEHPTYLGWVVLNDRDYGFVFQGAKGTVLVAWAPKGITDNINFGRNVQITDPLTGQASPAKTWALTDAPILVDGGADAWVNAARTNRNKPFPWGGDYMRAKSVSVTMGKVNEEKGLHTLSGSAIAADVVLYGGSARAGNIPGGNAFAVDPNFLSYTSVPIEITVTVRRDAANRPASLTLEYESTTGYKKLPAFEVPDNQEWSKATWRINDAQFVNMWGFNFRYNSGSYFVQSVTVTKLQN
jgi:polysaccharide biosynthesis protein PslG